MAGRATATPSPQNPIYALSPSDNPGTTIIHVVLKGYNYEEWGRAFRISLRAKRKLMFFDGTLKQPDETSADLDEWWTVNSMIVAWIFNTIDPALRTSISYRDVARDLWEDIKERFSVGNGVKIYQVKAELSDCKQKSGETIMSYYGRLKKLWDDRNDFDALPTCVCKGCKCDLTSKLRQWREAEQVREFLMGLESFYANVRSSLLGIEPLPSLNLVYSRLIQEEEVRTITGGQIEGVNPMSFAIKGGASHAHGSGGLPDQSWCATSAQKRDTPRNVVLLNTPFLKGGLNGGAPKAETLE
ncbi:unnamed protein product [Cuscuta epithymum]|uniref:Retrotransposon Copia-like N-terminal domain-containing protein n=1 Tax=Cuscuta epithymum TaxID=186058 RepID=A0AAV0GF83_9ASTE|nr:unnamed protein product [Cuscuta epithymum]